MFETYKSKINFMVSKILIGSGILMIAASVLGIVFGIYSSFAALKTSESAGIGAVSGSIEFALLSSIFIFVGFIFVIIGVVKLYKNSKTLK
jgi:hypothetical protein